MRSIINNKGFSLIELLVAAGITSFLIMVTVGLHLGSLSRYNKLEGQSSMDRDRLLISDFLRSRILASGGGSIRGWMGLWAEDDCDMRDGLPNCDGSDRLTLTRVFFPLQQCAITQMVSPTVIEIGESAPGECCLTFSGNEKPFVNSPVVLTLNQNFAQRFVASVDAATCRMTLGPSQAQLGESTGGVTDWTNATLTLVTVETLYLDSRAKTLNSFTDLNGNGTLEPQETSTLIDQAFDFQVALGYDFDPADGNIRETTDGVADEWLFNRPGHLERFGIAEFSPPLSPSDLMLVKIGVMIGSQGKGRESSSEQMFNGPQRTDDSMSLSFQSVKLSPRNTYVFQ